MEPPSIGRETRHWRATRAKGQDGVGKQRRNRKGDKLLVLQRQKPTVKSREGPRSSAICSAAAS
jgi:hypothetical protein